MGKLQRMALGAGNHRPHFQAQVVRTTAVTTDFGYFSLWQGTHDPASPFDLTWVWYK